MWSWQEEDLFKWEQTTYPEVEAITKAIEPYQKLFTTVVKWQRAEKKWMDGAFLELNAEATEAEVQYNNFIFRVQVNPDFFLIWLNFSFAKSKTSWGFSWAFVLWFLLTEPFSLDIHSKFLPSIPRALRCSRHLFAIFDRFHFTRYNSSSWNSFSSLISSKFLLWRQFFSGFRQHKLLTSCNIAFHTVTPSGFIR